MLVTFSHYGESLNKTLINEVDFVSIKNSRSKVATSDASVEFSFSKEEGQSRSKVGQKIR
jgi:hypothetical protein